MSAGRDLFDRCRTTEQEGSDPFLYENFNVGIVDILEGEKDRVESSQ